MKRILEILLSLFEKYDSVSTAFISRFYKNAKDKGIFNSMLDMCSRIMEDPTLQLINVVGALDRVYQIIITDKVTRQGTWNIFNETVESLDKQSKEIFFHREKSKYERIIGDNNPPKLWEDLWVKHIGDCSRVVLYGYCTKCADEYPIAVDLYQYIRGVTLSQDGYFQTKCTSCDGKDTLSVSYVIQKRGTGFK